MQVLSSDDFLKIMIAELTNQDPFEPMKNQDILNQMSAIQQLESNRSMSKSFTSLMDRYDRMLMGQELSSGSRMIGQLVSGATPDGQLAFGKVVAVNLSNNNILLELDTGQQININDIIRLGGSNSSDIIGETVIGIINADTGGLERKVVGKVDSIEIDGANVILNLQLHGDPDGKTIPVPLRHATVINRDSADLLIGYYVEGIINEQPVKGTVRAVEWTADDVLLDIGNDTSLPLQDLREIFDIS